MKFRRYSAKDFGLKPMRDDGACIEWDDVDGKHLIHAMPFGDGKYIEMVSCKFGFKPKGKKKWRYTKVAFSQECIKKLVYLCNLFQAELNEKKGKP